MILFSSKAGRLVGAALTSAALMAGGASVAQAATVHSGSLALAVRAEPTTNSASVASAKPGQDLGLECQVQGSTVAGKLGWSSTWYRVTVDGASGYVSASYVLNPGKVADCGSASATSSKRATATPSRQAERNGGSGTVRTGGVPLQVRSAASSSSKALTEVPNGARVSPECSAVGERIVGTLDTTTTWNRVSVNGTTGWVSAAYVRGGSSANVPACAGASGKASAKASSSAEDKNPNGPSWGPNGGKTPRAQWLSDRIKDQFGVECTAYKAASYSDHSTGNALDCWPRSSQQGEEITGWVGENGAALEVQYQIYRQSIWRVWDPTWTPMEDRGSTTANHFDHIHISMQTPDTER